MAKSHSYSTEVKDVALCLFYSSLISKEQDASRLQCPSLSNPSEEPLQSRSPCPSPSKRPFLLTELQHCAWSVHLRQCLSWTDICLPAGWRLQHFKTRQEDVHVNAQELILELKWHFTIKMYLEFFSVTTFQSNFRARLSTTIKLTWLLLILYCTEPLMQTEVTVD